ncbi:T9SS type A sorting domain-containing protein [Winogradskyella pacifica]|uniref:T9SS type A sorting domain-containing protein n=1 Tax=Winogradskyella pacifica TaxID=664642 RepID=UPI0015C9B1C4|nr:T9SS type A sorting domain-containing protein [Winogradskyella pacifica]
MKKITFLFLLLGISFFGFSQVSQNFGTNGSDSSPTVLTILNTDITINGTAPITEITLGNFTVHFGGPTGDTTYCGNYYNFDLLVVGGVADGTSILGGCDSDFNGLDITGFTAITITSFDADNWSDIIFFDIDLMVTFNLSSSPDCDAVLVDTENVSLEGDLSWSAATGVVDNYEVSVGTASGLSDVYSESLGNVLTTNIGVLPEGTTYYVTITPSNSVGIAIDCTEQTFTTISAASNDDPTSAIALILDEGTDCGANTITGSNFGTTDSGVAAPSCGNYGTPTDKGDLWYTFVAPSSGELTFNTSNLVDLVSVSGAYYSGTVGSLIEEGCTEFGSGWPWDLSGLTSGETYYLRIWDYSNDEIGTFDLCGYYVACTTGQATVETVSDCAASTYSLNVTFSTVGDATEVSDGTNSFAISGSAAVAGPYAFGTTVTLEVVHTGSDCDFELGTYLFEACAPENDDIANAVAIAVDEGYCDGTNTNANNISATNSAEAMGSCFQGTETLSDVWFTFTVPANVATVDVSTDFTGGTLLDTELAVYSGAPGNLVEIGCSQDDGVTDLSNGFSWNSLINDLAVTAGETYYIQIDGYTTQTGTFCLDISTNQVLSTNSYENEAAFTYYPNPVKNTLSLNAQKTIEQVSMFNMLGQEVLRATPNTVDSDLDMSNLATGAYFVKVTIANVTETIRVIKQ